LSDLTDREIARWDAVAPMFKIVVG